MSAAFLSKIEHEDTRVAASGPLEHLGMAKRMHRIAIAGATRSSVATGRLPPG
jgi:hypothetical protein